jgi:hypothetical protein
LHYLNPDISSADHDKELFRAQIYMLLMEQENRQYEKMAWVFRIFTAMNLLIGPINRRFLPSFPGLIVWYDIRLHLLACLPYNLTGIILNYFFIQSKKTLRYG